MAAGPQIRQYKQNLDQSLARISALQDAVEDFSKAAFSGGKVVEATEFIGDLSESAVKAIDNQLSILKATKQAGPLKAPSKVFEAVLKGVKPVPRTLEKTINSIDELTKDAQGDGQFLDFLGRTLENASKALAASADTLAVVEERLRDISETLDDYIRILDVATAPGTPYAPSYAGLNAAVEVQFGTRNAETAALEATHAAIVAKVEALRSTVREAVLDLVLETGVDLQAVDSVLDSIAGPLEIAASVIRPIEPILDAVGFVFDLLVGPIFDFLTETLGLDETLDSVAEKVAALFPTPEALERFRDQAQSLFDQFEEIVQNSLGIDSFAAQLEAALYSDVIGDPTRGPTGIGSDEVNVLLGDEGDDILDGRGGNDVVGGGGGNDLFVASRGDDFLDGGTGIDLVYFSGNFNEYELARDAQGRVVVTHTKPQPGAKNEGSETLVNFEHVVFANVAFTGAQLARAIIGGSVLNGTDANDLMFLNSSGQPFNGFQVANGFGGDDQIFGSIVADLLFGGTGDDVFIPGFGDDQLFGEDGTDTFQILAGDNSSYRTNLWTGLSVGREGQDVLNSIENAIIQTGGDHLLTGTDEDNSLFTATGDDVVTGAGGNDVIDTGDGKDVLIGGNGVDQLRGGAGRDVLLAGGATPGVGEFYDGGDGIDVLGYTRDLNVIYSLRSFEIDEQQAIKNAIEGGTVASGPVRIFATEGLIQHLDGAGNVIATDTAVGIESFVGSDQADTLFGTAGFFGEATTIHGGGGDDIIYAEGASSTSGGAGNDTLVATLASPEAEGIAGGNNFNGGGGYDVLDLDPVGEVRWDFKLNASIGNRIRAFENTREGQLQNQGNPVYSANVTAVEEFLLGEYDDEISFNSGSASTIGRFVLRGGNDFVRADGGRVIVDAGDGQDEAIYKTNGEFYGGAGGDRASFDDSTPGSVYDGGTGDDFFLAQRFKGNAEGGAGFDTLALDTGISTNVTVDLAAGTVLSRGTDTVVRVEARVSGFEQVTGTRFGDTMRGSAAIDQLVGLLGNDRLEGRGGADELYGGGGSDTLVGGNGNDRLHGGLGNDRLEGGAGVNTASYATAAVGSIEGDVALIAFGGVTVDLATGRSSGTHGIDTLIDIDNLVGSAGNDQLRGDGGANVLAGGRGADRMEGRGGDDAFILEGDDVAVGGTGADTFYGGAGSHVIAGGLDRDTLDFTTVEGNLFVSLGDAQLRTSVNVDVPVWNDTGTREARLVEGTGVLLTPREVLESDIVFANDAGDLARSVPEDERFDITLTTEATRFESSISGIENVFGTGFDDTIVGDAGSNELRGRNGADVFDPRRGIDYVNGGDGYDIVTLRGLDGGGHALFRVGGSVFTVDVADRSYDVMENVEQFNGVGQTITFGAMREWDPLAYLASHDDLARAFGTSEALALQHYIDSGVAEGRETDFDAAQYLANYGDLRAALGDDAGSARTHFLLSGINENRLADDPLDYVASYADLIVAFGGRSAADLSALGLAHYAGSGAAEGRRGGIDFDAATYLANHADLAVVFGADLDGATVHYINSGFAEQRLASDALDYIASNADLRAAFGGLDAASMRAAGSAHWQGGGFAEGRPTKEFDVDGYLANYADLRAAFADGTGGYDETAATLHFIRVGANEGRTDDLILA